MPRHRRRNRKTMKPTLQRWHLVTGAIVLTFTALGVLAGAATKYTEVVTVQPRRVEKLEEAYGRISSKVDGLATEVGAISQRLEMYSKSAAESQRVTETLLTKINASVELTRERVFQQDSAMAALKEKVVNTAVAVDDLRSEFNDRKRQ